MYVFFSERENLLLKKIQDKVSEGLAFIKQNEKLRSNEGKISLSFLGENNLTLELVSPHLVPNAAVMYWTGECWEEILNSALKDVTNWVELEMENPFPLELQERLQNLLDI